MSRPDSSQISMSTTVKRKVPLSRCSATAAESSPRQWLQTVGRQKIALPWPFSLSLPPGSVRTATGREEMLEEALSCLQEATYVPHLLADDPCSMWAREFPTAVPHYWASVHTDPDPKFSVKPRVFFFPVPSQGFGCGPLQAVAVAAAEILACVLQAMGIDDHSYFFCP